MMSRSTEVGTLRNTPVASSNILKPHRGSAVDERSSSGFPSHLVRSTEHKQPAKTCHEALLSKGTAHLVWNVGTTSRAVAAIDGASGALRKYHLDGAVAGAEVRAGPCHCNVAHV